MERFQLRTSTYEIIWRDVSLASLIYIQKREERNIGSSTQPDSFLLMSGIRDEIYFSFSFKIFMTFEKLIR